MPISHKIKDGAIFVADSHINKERKDSFLLFLEKIEIEKPPQLFLMGDIFDLLVGGVKSTIQKNQEIVQKINSLKDIEVFYFCGNHDFALEPIFKNIKIFNRQNQPQIFLYKDKKIALSHGDLWIDKKYEFYIKTIQNPFVLKSLIFLNSLMDDFLVKKICSYNKSKNLCKNIKDFKDIAKERVRHYKDVDLIIEGHFHQNCKFIIDDKIYINLPSFACGRKYMVFEDFSLKLKSF